MFHSYCLEVEGEYACFTRPEMKVERVSYEVMTPSAARAVYECILWKPAIRWIIEEIEILKPIRWLNVRRNEVGCVVSHRNVETAMKGNRAQLGVYIEEERQQRAALLLRDVVYRIHSHFEMTNEAGMNDNAIKFSEMFIRRAKTGQCINQPYLGCREFAADFRLIEEGTPKATPIDETRPLGWMLYDMDYSDPESPRAMFFSPELKAGVMRIPAPTSEEVKR